MAGVIQVTLLRSESVSVSTRRTSSETSTWIESPKAVVLGSVDHNRRVRASLQGGSLSEKPRTWSTNRVMTPGS